MIGIVEAWEVGEDITLGELFVILQVLDLMEDNECLCTVLIRKV